MQNGDLALPRGFFSYKSQENSDLALLHKLYNVSDLASLLQHVLPCCVVVPG